MPFVLSMPKLSPTMEGGTIVKWHKKEGDEVKEGDLLFEVATDKATVEYNALDGGFLRKIIVSENDNAEINQPVAILSETADEDISSFQQQTKPQEEKPQEMSEKQEDEAPKQNKVASSSPSSEPAFTPLPPLDNYHFNFPTTHGSSHILASPLAKNIAKEKAIDLSKIKGTGPNGRVIAKDLEGVSGADIRSYLGERPTTPPGSYDVETLTPMRKTIGKRLKDSKMFIPHFYVQHEVHVDRLIALREDLKSFGMKITYNDCVMRAVALALQDHPILNSAYDNTKDEICHFKTIDISVAVSIDGGIITPIVRHANYKSLQQLSSEVKKLVTAAKKQALKPEEFQGGSFTISNLGMYGIKDFQPIINPPQACILGVGGILEQPICRDGQVVAGHVMTLSLASDHRVVDGADAAAFLVSVKKLLENPSVLLV